VFVVVAAALAGPVAARVRAIDDAQDAKHAARVTAAVFVAGALFGLACFLFDRAAFASVERLVLSAISGESIDPSQRARLLMEVAPGVPATRVAMIFDTTASFLAFAPAIIGGLRRPAWGSIGGAIALVAVVALGMAGVAWNRRAKQALVDASTARTRADAPALPVIATTGLPNQRGSDEADSFDVIVRADGTKKEQGAHYGYRPRAVAPDRRARFADVIDGVLGTATQSADVLLVGVAKSPPQLPPALGAYASFLGASYPTYRVGLAKVRPSATRATLYLVATAPDRANAALVRRGGSIEPTELGLGESELDISRLTALAVQADAIVYAPLVVATVDDVYRALGVITHLGEKQHSFYDSVDSRTPVTILADHDGAAAVLSPPPPAPAPTAPPKKAPAKKK
jgi:hypothetical protein